MTLRPEPYRHLTTDRTYAALQALGAHAVECGTDTAALALAWVMAHPLVTAPSSGRAVRSTSSRSGGRSTCA